MDLSLKGSLIVAREGINGTLAGEAEGSARFVAALQDGLADLPAMTRLELKQADAGVVPFDRLKVKHKPEIVTLSAPEADPLQRVGVDVAPEDWNALLDDPDVILIDTRNGFEVAFGSFDGALDPDTAKFSEFPGFVEKALNPAESTDCWQASCQISQPHADCSAPCAVTAVTCSASSDGATCPTQTMLASARCDLR